MDNDSFKVELLATFHCNMDLMYCRHKHQLAINSILVTGSSGSTNSRQMEPEANTQAFKVCEYTSQARKDQANVNG